MDIDELKYYTIASQLFGTFNSENITEDLENLVGESPIYLIKEQISQKNSKVHNPLPENLKAAIIDFEGQPVFLVGLMIVDKILTFYVKDYTNIDQFYFLILKIMRVLREIQLFAFSTFENRELLKIYHYLETQGYDLSDYSFIEGLSIVNLQENKYESLSEAIYTIFPAENSVISTGDVLFRNIKLIPKLFSAQKFEEIISHNQNCLMNGSLIFLKRWLKHYKI